MSKSSPHSAQSQPASNAPALIPWLSACAAALLLAACGGGGDATPTSPTQTPERAAAYSAGPISGFGSVIVNGVRFDDSSAAVSDDDGVGHSRSELKLGMMVEVASAAVDRAKASGRAIGIRFGSALRGPVASVNAAAGTLTVLGQAVQVSATTVFGDGLAGGLAGLGAGTVLEVHGLFDATKNAIQATRLEVKTAAAVYRVRGAISNLDSVAKTFRIGGATIAYGSAGVNADLGPLANGQVVRVLLQTAQVNGAWVATALRTAANKLDDCADGHLRGSITAFTSSTQFSVNGAPVDARSASFPDGIAGIVLGARVEIEGSIVNGVLVATKVELDDEHAGSRHAPELHGNIASIDAAAKTFSLRGITVSYAGAVTYSNGVAADLAVGRSVEVKGQLGADRSTLAATRIKFE